MQEVPRLICVDLETANGSSQSKEVDMVSKVTEEFDQKMRNIPNYEANGHVKQSENQRSGPSNTASDTSQSHFEHPMSLEEVPMTPLNC